MVLSRRQLLVLLGATTGAAALGTFPAAARAQSDEPQNESEDTFELPPLPYDYNALEPYIDAETMRFHHDKHHASYTRKLNAAVAKYPTLQTMSAEELLRNISSVPEDIRKTVRQNGGGYVNHKMYWEIMTPDGGGEPTGALATAIDDVFGSFDAFKEEFNKAGRQRFGSGWAWLVRNREGKLEVMNTPNQDSPLMQGLDPIMGNDVWEHAYYLTYRNSRGEYLEQWWNVVNWEEVGKRFEQAIAA
jgi:Fe-Mn family superoxide dismutase